MYRLGIWVLFLALLLAASSAAAGTPFTLRGEFIQGGLVFGAAPPGSTVTQDGKPVRVGTSGEFLLGFDRDAPSVSEVEVILPDGSRHPVRLEVAARQYEIQRIDGLPPAKVTPRRPVDLERIRRDVAVVKAARIRDDDRPDFQAGFEWPARGRISGVYGSQRILNGEPRRPHYGVDVAAPTGTPVTAPAPGIVTLADPDLFFSGGTLILDHGHRLSSSFLHLHRLHVAVGERVEQGQLIGEIGATGRVTGPHLDWRMNLRDRRIDPTLLVPPMGSEAAAARP